MARHPQRMATALLAVAILATFTLVAVPADAGKNDPYLSASVPVATGCIVLNRAWAGVKVALVQRRLHTTQDLDRYLHDTYVAVRAFQNRRDLKVTGRVNRNTWQAMNIGRAFCMDRFTVQPTVNKPKSP